MYRVYSDSYLIHSDAIESLKIRNPQLETELNRTGSFDFSIYPDHLYYNNIQKLKSVITVYQDNDVIFRGRCLNDELGFHDEKQVVCEGQLAFLLDSIQRPYEYSGTVSGFFSALVLAHNNQVEEEHRFTVGSVTVTDSEPFMRSTVEYVDTWETINKELIEKLGGYIFTRNVGGVNYIDYVSDFSTISGQTIRFAENLLEMKRIRKGEEIVTALIPLGAKLTDEEGNETDERLTIKSVNNNLDYIYNQDAVDSFGWIFKAEIFDTITTASELLAAGQAALGGLLSSDDSIELSAADLASIENVESFRLGTYVKVESSPHGINQNFLISKLSINLLDPASNRLTLGGAVEGLAENIKHDQEIIINNMQGYVEETVVKETTSIASSLISQSATAILLEVSEGYFLKTDGDELGDQVGELSTTLSLTASAFQIHFNTIDEDLGTIHSYIRFEDGNILLGNTNSDLILKIENDKITFSDCCHEVAYFKNDKLYVTDGEFLNVLRIGNFAFVPRVTGNLSFTKIV